jgi:hypothetical protein
VYWTRELIETLQFCSLVLYQSDDRIRVGLVFAISKKTKRLKRRYVICGVGCIAVVLAPYIGVSNSMDWPESHVLIQIEDLRLKTLWGKKQINSFFSTWVITAIIGCWRWCWVQKSGKFDRRDTGRQDTKHHKQSKVKRAGSVCVDQREQETMLGRECTRRAIAQCYLEAQANEDAATGPAELEDIIHRLLQSKLPIMTN